MRDWLKMKNPAAPAVKREAEEDGRGRGGGGERFHPPEKEEPEMSTYEESHPVGEEWVDPVFGPVRRIPKPTPWQIPRGNWFMKKEDQEAARRALGEVLGARERADEVIE